MKIKNTFNSAFIKLWLVILAFVPAVAVVIGAVYTWDNPQPSVAVDDKNGLNVITELSISADAEFEDIDGKGTTGIKKNSYYGDKTWYFSGGSNRSIGKDSNFDNKKYFTWGPKYAIVVKLAPGHYKLSTFYRASSGRGICVYPGKAFNASFSKDDGYPCYFTATTGSDGKAGYETIELEWNVTSDNQFWCIGGADEGGVDTNTFNLYSVNLVKTGDITEEPPVVTPLSKDFPSDLAAINTNTFWYHNGGGGLYSNGTAGDDGCYRYFVANSSGPYAPTTDNTVTINGKQKKIENTDDKEGIFKSYEIKPGDAIGFKLGANNKYRIKIYYYGVAGDSADNYAEADLRQGPNVDSAWPTSTPVKTIIKGDYGKDTNTRLHTYEITTGDYEGNNVYWVKNTNSNGKSLYLGGFEILPLKDEFPSGEFTGVWNVADNPLTRPNSNFDNNADDDHKNIYVADSHGNVCLCGPSMTINDYLVSGKKSVMVNFGNFIAVNIPAGATLNFKYIADNYDSRITLKEGNDELSLSNDEGATLNFNKFANYEGNISYTNDTQNAKLIWIVGASENYAYFSGFEVTTSGETTPSFDNAIAIDKDYVWYPVTGKTLSSKTFTDSYTLNVGDELGNNGGNLTFNEQSHPTYSFTGDNILGFKIAANKSGVINIYMPMGDEAVMALYGEEENAIKKFDENRNHLGLVIKANVLDDTQVNSFYFETGASEETYFISTYGNKGNYGGSSQFGGFEVLFDNGGNSLVNWTKVDDSKYKFDIGSVKSLNQLKNAIGDDMYNWVNSNVAGVYGPSMMCCPVPGNNTVMIGSQNGGDDIRNAIVFKLSDAKFNTVEINSYLKNGASIKVYEGSEFAPRSALVKTISGSGNVTENVPVSYDKTYWLISDNPNGAYVINMFEREENVVYDALQTINENYIYKVDGKPEAGVLSGENGHIKFDGSAEQGPNMTVLGQSNPSVALDNGQDAYGFKIGPSSPSGFTTGVIKVYFNSRYNEGCFNGGKVCHKMEEINLDKPLTSGTNSSYDTETHIVSLGEGSADRGWWFGEGTGARDMSAFNKINIEVEMDDDIDTDDVSTLQLVVKDVNGNAVTIDYKPETKRFLGELKADGFDISKVSQIFFQTWGKESPAVSFKLKSVRVMNKPLTIATGTIETYDSENCTEVFGGIIHDVQDAHVYEFPFNVANGEQLFWVTGDINLAAIQVVYDNVKHAKVVEWYVNKDTKMIVGSDDPNWVWTGFDGKSEIKYPGGYDEYVTFYMSAGRQANVSFVMPEAVREVYDWEQAMKAATAYLKFTQNDGKDTDYIDEDATDNNIPTELGLKKLSDSYGKHTIETKVVDTNGKDGGNNLYDTKDKKGVWFNGAEKTYKRSGGQSKDMKKISGDLYSWYGYSYDLPAAIEDTKVTNSDGKSETRKYVNQDFYAGVSVTATQKVDGKNETEYIDGKEGQWKIYMRFVAFQSPELSSNQKTTNGSTTTSTVSLASSRAATGDVFYTIDSSEPESQESLTTFKCPATITSVTSAGTTKNISDMNCIIKAAQYLETPYVFYDDCSLGEDSETGKKLKIVSKDLSVVNDIPEVVYVKNKKTGDDELFNTQDGGYMLTIPTGSKLEGYTVTVEEKDEDGKVTTKTVSKHEQVFNANPTMYLTLGGKDHPYLNGSVFNLCGTNWKASDDSGLKTYLDSYKFKFDVAGVNNPDWWGKSGSQNQNPYTECNFGPGGDDTEDGGMFLQPISGTMLRFEPEYDGVITVWLRQNGCLDNNTQELGTFTRRPVYIMDENGRVMRRSTWHPTAEHYLGINGTYAINSSVCEQRNQVEFTWLHAVAKQVFENHPIFGYRFNDASRFPNRWEDDGIDHGGHIMYGRWYDGFNIAASLTQINSASYVSRFNYMDPELLYRSDKVFDMEKYDLGLNNGFAKYGYELPNFQYVRYRIPVKAGKTYYIAGRGTKNGFSAIRFDVVKANTNAGGDDLDNLRYADNYEMQENSATLKLEKKTGGKVGSSKTAVLKSDDAKKSYEDEGLKSVTIDENGQNLAEIKGVKIYDMDGEGNVVGQTVNVTLNRTFTAGHWHPIILPFSLSETRVEQYFGEGTVVLYLDPYDHTLHNPTDKDGNTWISAISPALENSRLSFTYHRYQMLYANTPAFICPTFTWSDDKKKPATDKVRPTVSDKKVSSITFKRVTIDGSNLDRNTIDEDNGYYGYAISNDYEVVGSYNSATQYDDVYFVTNNANGAQLMHSDHKGVNMKATRVWIRPRAGVKNYAPILTVGAKEFSELDFGYGNEEAGISDIVVDDITVEGYANDEGVYDLMGRKMGEGSTDGLPAGVYIFKGQKVYVK